MARDGFAALERFGAELGAMLDGQPAPTAAGAARPTPTPAARPSGTNGAVAAEPSAAELDAELARVLTEDGIVVRGHDVARVVGLANGTTVTWED
jgi:hypothetical protein